MTTSSSSDGGSSRVSIPNHLRKTLHSIREITGKQHSDEDIFAVYKESFNDPHETAQRLLFLDTFHEVKSKRDKKKESLVPINQGGGRGGQRNVASSYQDAGNGRGASFKRENGANHVARGSRTHPPAINKARNLTVSRAPKVSGPSATVNKELAEKTSLSKSTSSSEDCVELETSKATSEQVAAPVSVSVVQNHIQDNNQPTKLQSSTLGQQDQVITVKKTASIKRKTQSLRKSDVGERSHVTFPFHLQADEVLQNGLTFGSFDSNIVKEASSNNGASGGDDSSLTTNGLPREGATSFFEDKDHGIANPAPGTELVLHSDHVISPVEDERREEALPNTQAHQISYGQEAPFSVFGLVPSLSALGQPVNTESAETQPGNSNALAAIPLASYPPDQRSIVAASQQALFRQQYPHSFFPYGPYYPPFYMPPPYIHQFLSANGIPQQSYFPPPAALAAPTHINPVGDTENPSPNASSPVATPIPTAIASENTSALAESTAAWIAQLSNLQLNPMYNLALQSQPLGFPYVQAGHGGLMGIHQPTQPMAAVSTTYQTFQTLPPPPHTTVAMTQPIGQPQIAYQQPHQRPQATLTNWVNNY